MVQRLVAAWRRWRENSRQYKIDRALYKAQGGVKHHEGGGSPGGSTAYPPGSGTGTGGF
jgi:hypothetical protein